VSTLRTPVILPVERDRSTLLGLALGDALGTTLEFSAPGTFTPLSDLVGGGPFRLPAGAWTDDTSMALCLAESLVERGGFDAVDQLARYVRWWRHGHLSSTGRCFDIGGTVRAALQRFQQTGDPASGSTEPSSAGNGSLMRLAPVVLAFASNPREAVEMAAASSRTTHGAREAVDACRYMAALLVGALAGESKERLLSPRFEPVPGLWHEAPLAPRISEVADGSFRRKDPPGIRGTGYVVESLEAVLWAFDRSTSFREGALLAVNLGDDADTTGAIYGQLAGAHYGLAGLPQDWLSRLVGPDMIERLADGLFRLAWDHVHPAAELPVLDGSLEEMYRATVLHYVDARGAHFVATPADQPAASAPAWDLPDTFYVVTAWNPASADRSHGENTAADRRLEAALRARNASMRRMDGASADGSWYERGFAVWNIPAGSIAGVAREFGQNAFLIVDRGSRRLGAGVCIPDPHASQPIEVRQR
jgi:ADP-ribosyl-[dinitrogen reductase] hydrolase